MVNLRVNTMHFKMNQKTRAGLELLFVPCEEKMNWWHLKVLKSYKMTTQKKKEIQGWVTL